MSDLRDTIKRGYISKEFNFNTILSYFSDPDLTPILQKLITLSALPLRQLETKFAVDATGVSTSHFGRWLSARDLVQKDMREWLKLHLSCG
jgi:hypothetical protein